MKKRISRLCAWGSVACLSALVVKYPLRKLGLNKANAAMMKLHEGASSGYFLLAQIHMTLELLGKKKNAPGRASGLFGLGLGTWLITDCHIAKNQKAKMQRHRIYSLLLVLDTTAHILLAKRR